MLTRMKDVAIVGLPGSGKSTVFRAVSKGATRDPMAVVDVPDLRLDRLTELYDAAKTVRAQVRLIDVAGIDPHSLNAARAADALAIVLRAFGPDIDVARDLSSFRAELAVADLATVEKVHERASRGARTDEAVLETATCERAEAVLSDGRWLAEEPWTPEQRRVVEMWTPLTLKPAVHVVNASEPTSVNVPEPHVVICGALEAEATELPDEDATVLLKEFGITERGADAFIRAAYEAIGLLTFFTASETEARAWETSVGSKAPQAAGEIHSDFERAFIRAERVRYEDLIEAGSEDEARKRGLVRLEGKDYVVQEGDVLHIRHSA
jgi:ribosome-binding ATPase YchF (GTP1/OBG family)